jgi:signal transduction histidine kinase
MGLHRRGLLAILGKTIEAQPQKDLDTLASEFFRHNPDDCVRLLQQMATAADPEASGTGAVAAFMSCRDLQRLASMQLRASRNYFRLLEADRDLRARASATPQTIGAILADSIEGERQRLGRELHTGVGQSLAGIYVHVSLLEESLPDPPEPVRKNLSRIAALATAALEQVRGVSRRLYVPAWQTQSLVEALRSLWEASGISEKFTATLDLHELSAEPPPEVRRAIYLVAQEGISNVIQHAHASRVRMSLGEQSGRIALEVADDGSGFRAPADPARPVGIGLRSMHDLARQLGGDLQARSTPEGAKLIISFPVIHA